VKTSEKVLIVAAVAIAGGVLYSELGGRRGDGGGLRLKLDTGVDIGDDVAQPWTCQPSDMGGRLAGRHHRGNDAVRRPHPLYRRPAHSRPTHARLVDTGWQSWYLDPPSEASA
jgi:hypothetical protein